MTSAIRLWAAVLGSLLVLAVLAGCGGGGAPALTSGVQVRIHWPEGSRATLVTAGGVGARITVTVNEAYEPTLTRWVTPGPEDAVTTVTLLGVPAGQAVLRVDAYATAVEAEANNNLLIATGQTSLTVIAGQQIFAVITLTPITQTSAISGYVYTAYEQPLAGATVTTTDGVTLWTTTTDEQGYYTLTDVPPGQRVVTVTHPSWGSVYEQTVVGDAPVDLSVMLALTETVVETPPTVQMTAAEVDEEIGVIYLTGTVVGVDAPFVVLIVNGYETLVSLSQAPSVASTSRPAADAMPFNAVAILSPGENVIRVRATNAAGTTISDPLTVIFTPSDYTQYYRVTLSWDGAGDLDLHTWLPDLTHCYYGNRYHAAGILDVDNTYANGPENFTGAALVDGRVRVAVNAFSAAGRAATIRVTVNHGPNAGRSYTFGPYYFSSYNYNAGYPITGNTDAWWRPCDIVIAGDLISVEAPDATPLPAGDSPAYSRKRGK